MLATLRTRGFDVASVELPGELLVEPPGLSVRRSGGNLVLERRLDGDGAPDVLVGKLPLLCRDPSTGLVRVELMEIPPPPPFAVSDVEAMWSDVESDLRPLPESVLAQGRTAGQGAPVSPGLDDEAVPLAFACVAELQRRWPELETSEIVWRATDVRGGREDVRETERLGGRLGGRPRGSGPAIPDFTARRLGTTRPWGARRLAVACRTLEARLRERAVDGDQRELGMIGRAAHVSERHSRGRDESISSWPHAARATFRHVVRALVHLSFADSGTASLPLCHLWRLYEAWVAVRTLHVLQERLGDGQAVMGSPWGWEWQLPSGALVQLHAQATIGATPDPGIGDFVSVSSDLRPDGLIVVRQPGGGQGLICVDAKQRTAATAMEATDVASAASKYNWGLRHAGDPSRLAVRDTIIVSSAPLRELHDADRASIRSAFLVPSNDGSGFRAELLAALDAAL